jgi:spore coat polysaccharide biosynthesis protein SpsF
MKIVIIVQARMGSTRFPGKILKTINNQPMLIFQYKRLQRSKLSSLVCVATTNEKSDDIINELCLENNIPVFRGSETDVLKRYHDAANYFNADVVVRINSDCPLIDPSEVDKVINEWINSNPRVDYASNILEETFPLGMHTEVFSIQALEKAHAEARLSDEREHVTPYIYRNPSIFNLQSIVNNENLSHYRWTVDYPEDLDFVREVANNLIPKENFGMMEVVELINAKPNLKKINNMYKKRQNILQK